MKPLQKAIAGHGSSLLLCLLFCCLATRKLQGGPVVTHSPMDGTFLQLLEEHGNWTDERWKQLFDDLHSLGIRRLIVQWSVADGLAFYPSTQFRGVKGAPLEKLLQAADAAHFEVTVGLLHDSDYWTNIKQDPPLIATYLRNLRAKSLATVAELLPILNTHPSVGGWYISEEIDDITWRKPDARSVLLEHEASLAAELKRKTPTWSVSISAFSQAQSSPAGFEHFWGEFLSRVQVDTVLYQDGVGVAKLDMNGLPVYLQAMRNAAEKNHRCLTVVVELFRQTSGPPLNDSPFAAVPAPIERIGCQLALADKFASGGIIGFSVPEYMTPQSGEPAAKLFNDYQHLINSGEKPACSDPE